MRVVQRMGMVKTDANDKPVDDVQILKARVAVDGEE
jgi:peptidyl-prolyl cis-trans isomerase-like 1